MRLFRLFREACLLIRRGNIAELRRKITKIARNFATMRRVSKWRPQSSVVPSKLLYPPKPKEVGTFLHVFYPEYLPRIESILTNYAKDFPNVVFNFTTTDEKINLALLEFASKFKNVGLVRLCFNRGRNFGPLLVSFQDEITEFEYVIHVHTKKSLHADKKTVEKWVDLLWGNLLEDIGAFRNNLSLLRDDKNLSLLYPIDLKLFHPISFSWAGSREYVPLEVAQSSAGKLLEADRFPFPIGGMFMASSIGLRESLLTRRWVPEDFPEESGQTDATVQHALERIIGCLSWKGGTTPKEQIVLFPSFGAYTSDSSFCLVDLSSRADRRKQGLAQPK